MRPFSLVRTALPLSALVVALGATGVIFAQSFDVDVDFNMMATFPNFPSFPYSSEYVRCVAPAVRAHEDALVRIHSAYERHKVRLIGLRADARVQAWLIPERSARSRALRDIDRAFRDNDRALSRWLRDQERSLKRQFNDAEDRCDDQFDNDIDFDGDGRSSRSSSSRSSSRSSSSIARCDHNEIACSPLSEIICGCPGKPITFVGCRSNGCARCPRCPSGSFRSSSSSSRSSSSSFVSCFGNDMCLPVSTCHSIGGSFVSPGRCGNQSQMEAGHFCCTLSSSSSSRSSSSSSFHTTSFQGDASFEADGNIESCSCDIVCDPSGSPCMAVCSAEC